MFRFKRVTKKKIKVDGKFLKKNLEILEFFQVHKKDKTENIAIIQQAVLRNGRRKKKEFNVRSIKRHPPPS